MSDEDLKILRGLYETYGYSGVRSHLDAWDDEAVKQKMAYLADKDTE